VPPTLVPGMRLAIRSAMHAADTLLIALLNGVPRQRLALPPQIHIRRLSAYARAELEDLILGLEKRLRSQGLETQGVRSEVLELLGIDLDAE
jgi:flavin-dependent dehydrogenase